MAELNRQWRLAARPVGLPRDTDWQYVESPVEAPGEGAVLVRARMLSLDPAMRGWMNEGRSYIAPVGIGEVMRAGGVGEVIASRHASYAVGEVVQGLLGVQTHALLSGEAMAGLSKVDVSLAPMQKWLNPLGMTGMTAYFGLLDVGRPEPGQTVVVSGAAGAVGQTVGQIARIKGCRAVGIAGGADKCRFVTQELGFDACIDYKHENVRDGLRRECPKGIDVYFDNVGGEILDTVLTRITRRARIVICGAISQYNATEGMKGPANYMSLLVNRARMEGFVVFDYADRYGEAVRELAGWMREGRLKSREDIVEGIERFPQALNGLFSGANFGKLILKV